MSVNARTIYQQITEIGKVTLDKEQEIKIIAVLDDAFHAAEAEGYDDGYNHGYDTGFDEGCDDIVDCDEEDED